MEDLSRQVQGLMMIVTANQEINPGPGQAGGSGPAAPGREDKRGQGPGHQEKSEVGIDDEDPVQGEFAPGSYNFV